MTPLLPDFSSRIPQIVLSLDPCIINVLNIGREFNQ